jgi:hypothetical protein
MQTNTKISNNGSPLLENYNLNNSRLLLLNDKNSGEKSIFTIKKNSFNQLKSKFFKDNFIENRFGLMELQGEANEFVIKFQKKINDEIDKKLIEFSTNRVKVKSKKDNVSKIDISKSTLTSNIKLYNKNNKIKYRYYKYKTPPVKYNMTKLNIINKNILSIISNPVNNLYAVDKLVSLNGSINNLDINQKMRIKKSKLLKDKNSYKSKYALYLPKYLLKDNANMESDLLIASDIKNNIKNILQFSTGIYNYQIPTFFDFSA